MVPLPPSSASLGLGPSRPASPDRSPSASLAGSSAVGASSSAPQGPSASRFVASESPNRPEPGIREHEGMLSAYLLARAAMGNKVDPFRVVARAPNGRMETPENLAKDLRLANDTLEESRVLLHQGRGNVWSDILETNGEALRRMEAGRNLADNYLASKGLHRGEDPAKDIWVDTAVSCFTGQATCHGSSLVTAHVHAPKLGPDQSAIVFRDISRDHQWTEVVRPGQGFGNDQIVDRWTEGPAVLREDSKYGREPQGQDVYTLNAGNRDRALNQIGEIAGEMRRDRSLHARFGTDMTRLEGGNRIFQVEIQEAESVLRDRFLEKAGRTLHPRSSKVPMSDRVLETDRKAPVRPYAQEILAAGVARSLGEGVRGAAEKAPVIVDAAKQVFPRPPRRDPAPPDA